MARSKGYATCGKVYPHAVYENGADIVCTLFLGHTGEHEDHSHDVQTGEVICWSNEKLPCGHKEWRIGRCAEMICWNYVNKHDNEREQV
jgi:hypothetical protein